MSLDQDEVVIGAGYISFGGVDLGLTEDDGLTIKTAFESVKLKSAQTIVVGKTRRFAVEKMLSAKFQQLSFEKWALLEDLVTDPTSTELVFDYSSKPTERLLVVTIPGPNDSTLVYSCMAVVATSGDMVFANKEFTGKPVEFQLIGDPTNSSYGSILKTASSATVPALQSVQKIVAGTPTDIADGATSVEVTSKIQFTFNVSIRPDMLNASHFILKTNAGNAAIAGSFAYGTTTGETDYAKVVFTPTASLGTSAVHDAIAVQGIRSFDGLATAGTVASQFTTAS